MVERARLGKRVITAVTDRGVPCAVTVCIYAVGSGEGWAVMRLGFAVAA
jgi:hypothetical protein